MYLGVSKNISVDKVVVGRLHKRYVKKSWLKKSYTVSVGKFSHFSQGTWFKLLEPPVAWATRARVELSDDDDGATGTGAGAAA